MSGESLDVRVARLEEQADFAKKVAEQASEDRVAQTEAIKELKAVVETMGTKIVQVASQMTQVTEQLASHAPTIKEFIEIKHKVDGAGKVGRYLWILGGGLLTLVFAMREIIMMILHRPPPHLPG